MRFAIAISVALSALAIGGCVGNSGDRSVSPGSDLTLEQVENGIGPVSSLEFGDVDPELVREGANLFDLRCSPCHKIGARLIGPYLAGVLERRSPAFVMNMILNPDEMIERHPEARALLREFKTPMANQALSEDEARAIVEWLRTAGG